MPIDRKFERDIDVFLAEEFSCSSNFSNWFLGKTQFAGEEASVEDVFLSRADHLGESDLIVLFKRRSSIGRFALLIEDKIDAPFQPDQEARYRLRGNSEVQRGTFDSFAVILCAPESYQGAVQIGQSFDALISYEEIGRFIESDASNARSQYRAQFIQSAARRNANLWVRVDDKTTNDFWDAAYLLAAREFTILEMKPLRVAQGSTWINFRPHDMPTMPQRYYVSFKGDRGQIDLTFTGSIAHKFGSLIRPLLDPDMTIHQTGKSAAIRIQVEGFNVAEPWSTVEPKVRTAFSASERLIRFFRANQHALNVAAASSLRGPSSPAGSSR